MNCQIEKPVAAIKLSTCQPTVWSNRLTDFVWRHRAFKHNLFKRLAVCLPDRLRVAALLRNYDAHASVLRRLLLKAACIMPEAACTFVIENVRNEYGNGNPQLRHQLQLIDLANKLGITSGEFKRAQIESGVKRYIKRASELYCPTHCQAAHGRNRPAIAAGAITATEILAIKEFTAMQKLFERYGLGHHKWFDHLITEVEHSDESLALALYFIEEFKAENDVLFGLNAMLDATVDLYDGLSATLAK